MKRIAIFTFILLAFITKSLAQGIYPVRVISYVTPPAPASLSDFANPSKNPIKVSLQLQDLTLGSRQVYLKTTIQGPGVAIQSNEGVTALSINLTGGALSAVPSAVMAQYFSPNFLNVSPTVYQRPLPAGLYTFSFEVFDVQTRVKLSATNSTPPVWIEQSQPPVLVMPQNTYDVPVFQVQNIIFQWTPRHSQINDVAYEFVLTELPIINRGNIQNVFLSQPPLFKTIISTNNFVYSAQYPPLREGYTYAWRVQAKAKLGRESKVGTFVNDGISEIYSFRYVNSMRPPTFLTAAWGSDYKNLNFTWKGEKNHQRYDLVIKDASGRVVRTQNIAAQANNTSYSVPLTGLSPTQAYVYQVVAFDVISRKAETSNLNLAALSTTQVNQRLATKIEIKGNLKWVYRASETNIQNENSFLATRAESRKTDVVKLNENTPAPTKYALKDATVGLYGSNDAVNETITDFQNNLSKLKLLESIKSDESGDFKTQNVKVSDLRGFKNYYVHIAYKNKAITPVFVNVTIDESASTNRSLGNFTVLARTFRYAPKLFETTQKLRPEDLEEFTIYRLKPVFEREKTFLEKEGNATRDEIKYNGNDYVKIADFQQKNIIPLFDNALFADQFIARIKEKDRDAVHISINSISNNSQVNETARVSDILTYIRPNPKVRGLVSFGTENKNVPSANTQVSVFSVGSSTNLSLDGSMLLVMASWKATAKTNDKGNFELEIPASVISNTNITKIGIMAYRSLGGKPEWKIIDKPTKNISQNIYFQANGVSIAGNLKDQFGRPVASALVSHPDGGNVRTNEQGAFMINIIDESFIATAGNLTVKAQDFKDASIDISKFSSQIAPPNSDKGISFWKTKIKEFSDVGDLAFEATNEVFKADFEQNNSAVSKTFIQKDIKLESIEHLIHLKTYTKVDGKKNYVSSTILLNNEAVSVGENGLKKYVKGKKLSFSVSNPKDASLLYLEDKIDDFDLPVNSQKGETITIDVMLKEAIKMKGTMIAFNKDSVKKGFSEDVSIKVKGRNEKATSNSDGKFEILLPKSSKEESLTFEKDKYNKETYLVKNPFLEKEYHIYEQDSLIPKFTHLQGFTVIIEKAINRGSFFEISGKIDPDKLEGAFKLEKDQQLTFNDIPVKKDQNNATNALLSREEMGFEEMDVKVKLHSYLHLMFRSRGGIKLIKIVGQPSKGKISGFELKMAQSKFLGNQPETFFTEIGLKLVEGKTESVGFNRDLTESNQKALDDAQKAKDAARTKEEKDTAKEAVKAQSEKERQLNALPDETLEIFASEGIVLKTTDSNAEYNWVMPMKEAGVPNDFIPLKKGHIPIPVTKGFFKCRLDVAPDSAIVTRSGININGAFHLPIFFGMLISSKIELEEIVVANNENLDLSKAAFIKKSGNFFTLGVKKSWRLAVDRFQVFDNFERFGIGGKLYTSEENHFIINSFTVQTINDVSYPCLDMKFPETGFRVKSLVFKSNPKQNIIFKYNTTDSAYQLDAGAIIEYDPTPPPADTTRIRRQNATITDATPVPQKKSSINVFPIEVQKLMINTNGAFIAALKANVSIPVGPIKVNVRRLLFSKGKTLTFNQMNQYLLRDETENKNLSETSEFNNTNYADPNSKPLNIGETYKPTTLRDADIVLGTDYVNWAFGFAGGVQIENLKGANVKTDASFMLGDFGKGLEVKFNSFDLVIDNPTFKALVSVNISTLPEKTGFEGIGEVETITKKFGGSLKFYKLPKGIEFGISLVATTSIITGPITWSSIGGAIDINTQTNKYMVTFLGSAYPSASRPDVTEFRDIKVSVLFSTNDCGALPVVEGSMKWYNKKEFYCDILAKIDFCRTMLLATVNCDKEIFKGTWAKLNATLFVSKSNFFLGASVRVSILKMEANGTLMLSANTNFNDVNTPKEVKNYSTYISPQYLTNRSTADGIFLKCSLYADASSSGSFWIASYSVSYRHYIDGTFIYNWKTNVFHLGIKGDAKVRAEARFLGASIGGGLEVKFNVEGGYNSSWYFDASVAAKLELVLGDAWGYSCNSTGVKWCRISIPCGLSCCCGRWWRPRVPRCSIKWCGVSVPCGLNAKGCIRGSVQVSYRNGWSTKF
jgi:hypothetical protein